MIGVNNSPDYTSTAMQLEPISQGIDTIPLISLRVKYALTLFAESKSSPTISCSNAPFTNNHESF